MEGEGGGYRRNDLKEKDYLFLQYYVFLLCQNANSKLVNIIEKRVKLFFLQSLNLKNGGFLKKDV